MMKVRKGFMFKSFILTVLCCFTCSFYGMPEYLSALQCDCQNEILSSFLARPTALLLDVSLSRTAGLAFQKAWKQRDLAEKKHFDALYQLFFINKACEVWNGTEGSMMYAIKSAFYSFHCEGFDETLTEEERSDFEKLAGNFFAKYYKFHPEELEEGCE